MRIPAFKPLLGLIPIGLIALLFTQLQGCDDDERDALAEIQQRGTLRVVTRNSPSTYYENRGQPTGFEYNLVKEFADFLDVDLDIQVVYNVEEVFTALRRGKADLAAAGITAAPDKYPQLTFGPGYMTVKKFVIYRRGEAYAEEPKDLIGRHVRVLADSSQSAALEELRVEHPELSWEEERDVEVLDLLDQLENREIEFTVIDSNQFMVNRGFYPQLRVGFSIGEPADLAWALSTVRPTKTLNERLEAFFEQYRESGQMASLIERFYGHQEGITQINSQTFIENMERTLPEYKAMIEEVALEYGIDWRLLAAISYQESHWDPRAKSPTGVRGMMMLTRITAKEMGVKNRLDARQSLRGGARYLNWLKSRLDEDIKEPDRTWFTLAAYNVGYGHLLDARKLTKELGGNPDVWADVKQHLPKLRQKKWYSKLRYGFARGDEPVHYVRNVRHYYSLITWTDLSRVRKPPPKTVSDYVPEPMRSPLLYMSL